MASKITAATLTVKITETLRLNDRNEGGEVTLSIPSINEIFKRIVTVSTTSDVELYNTSSGTGTGGMTFPEANVKYARITNLDDTNYILLVIRNTGADEAVYKLAAGETFILHGHDDTFNTDDAAIVDITAGLAAIDQISAQANTAAVDVEVFVAAT
jgi:hypothetical protein